MEIEWINNNITDYILFNNTSIISEKKDTKKNIIYILSLNLDKGKNENAICENGNEFQTNLEAIRRKIKEYNKND